jgi:hypothetical protein
MSSFRGLDAARHEAQVQWPAAMMIDGVRHPQDA